MAISNGHEIKQVNMASIINTINSVFLDCIVTSHMFSEQHLFFYTILSPMTSVSLYVDITMFL